MGDESERSEGNDTPAGVGKTEKFDKFTERARKVLSLAQEEAERFNHNYIATEHLLLGLVREGNGVAAKVLNNLGVELNKVRSAVEFIIGRGDPIVLGEIGLTPRSKRVIELAMDEAERFNHNYIGTEHLLLGLVREGEGIAAGVLESLDVNLEKVRRQTTYVLRDSRGPNGEALVKPSRTPALDEIGIDLTRQAEMGELDPQVGREQEIELVIQILARRQKNNPVLISTSSFSKMAIVEGVAEKICTGEVPATLAGKRLLTADIGSLLLASRDQGELGQRLRKIIEETRASKDCILFIDEMHTLFGAGGNDGAGAAASILKPALSRGDLQCIGATTLDEYRKYIEKDAALQRRFQEVIVYESTVEETVEILMGLRERYEQHHQVIITDNALRAAAEMGNRFIIERFMPDKAIDLIDDAASRVRMQRSLAPLNLRKALRELGAVQRDKTRAIQSQDYDQAAELRDREIKLRGRIAKLESGWQRDGGSERLTVTEEHIAQIVSMWTGIPIAELVEEEPLSASEIQGPLPAESPLDPTRNAKIFISYSHEDEDLCRAIASELSGAGYNTWYDYHIPGGATWIDEIERKIRERHVFVLLVSPEAMSSYWVRQELQLAMRLKKKIVPIRVRPTSLSESFLGSFQVLDGMYRDGQYVAHLLLTALRELSVS